MEKEINSKEKLLSEVEVSKAIRTLAVPAILGTLIMAVYNLVDTAFIGMLNSTESLSAISVAFPIMSLLNAFGQILGVGAATYIGILLGRKNHKEANETSSTIVIVSLIAGVLFAIIGVLAQGSIFKIFGASEAVLPFAKKYGTWMFVGAIFTVPNQALNNVARAETNARLSAIAICIGAVINVILDPIFMFDFGFGLGIEGASIATTISQGISFLFLMIYFIRGKSLLKFSFKNFKLSKTLFKEVLSIGAPSGAALILVSVSVAVTNIVAAQYGDNVVAAFGIVLKVISVGQFIIFGYVQGFQPIASYSFGAGNMDRFSKAFKVALKFSLSICIFLTVVYIVFSEPIMGVFTSDPQVIEVGRAILFSQVILYVSMGIVILFTAVFQSLGQGVRGIALSISRQGIFFFPLIFVFPAWFGLLGLYLVQPVADVFSLLMAFILYKKIKSEVLIPKINK